MNILGDDVTSPDLEQALHLMQEWADRRGINDDDYAILSNIAKVMVARVVFDEEVVQDTSKLYTPDEKMYMWSVYALMAAYQLGTGKKPVLGDATSFDSAIEALNL